MEAGVTTATRRLRRAGIAGLATVATAGMTVFATGGSALAFSTSGAATLTAGTSATLAVGTKAQALDDLSLAVADTSGAGWSAGDYITFEIDNHGAPDTELCDT